MDKLIEALKKVLIASGLKEDSKEFKNAIKPENFKEIKSQLEIKLPTTLDEALKLPGIQSLYDKKVTEATQSRETNLKEKWDFVEKGKGTETNDQKAIRELQEKGELQEKQIALDKKTSSAEKLLEDKKIPKSFLKHFDFNSETSLDEQLTGVESTFTEIKQGIITDNVGNGLPLGGGAKGEASEEELDNIIEDI